jgi:C-lobe and N-lobe beta barrels of Tf-binding protein B
MKTLTPLKCLAIATLSFALVACGGGGGGGSSGSVTVTPFTSWGAIQPNSTVQATGTSIQASGGGFAAGDGTFTGTYNSSPVLTAFTASTSTGSSATFNKNGTDTFAYSGDLILAKNAANTSVAVLVDPVVDGWNYQSYGVWVNSSPATVAAVSIGSLTAVANIPTSGTGAFTGGAGGIFYNSGNTTAYAFGSNMNANVNFATRSIAFSTTNSWQQNISTGVTTTNVTALNLSGTLGYFSGTNSFTGTLASNGTYGLSGTATGKFYGPTANELGGTFGLNTSSATYMIGGFGGKR